MTTAETKPLDLSWDEVGPKPRPEPTVEASAWDELDKRVRASISEVLNRAEKQFSTTPLGRMDAVAAIPAVTTVPAVATIVVAAGLVAVLAPGGALVALVHIGHTDTP